MFLSVIVATYNSEEYIVSTLNSIMSSSFNDFEVIIVDDGSSDKTVQKITENFKDSRLKIYQQKHMGPANIKNYGIHKAQGEYIAFLDSDDLLDKNFLTSVFKTIKNKKPDLIIYKYSKFLDQINDFKQKTIIGARISNMGTMIWNKVYAANILKRISFPENTVFEDVMFSAEAFLTSENVVYLDEVLYHYRQRVDSLTKNKDTKADRHLDIIKCFNSFFDYIDFNKIDLCNEYKEDLSILMNTLILDHCKSILKENSLISDKRRVVKKLLEYRKTILNRLNVNKLDYRRSKTLTKGLDLHLLKIGAFNLLIGIDALKRRIKEKRG